MNAPPVPMIQAFRDWFFDHLAMYAAYHRDRRNQLTHYAGIPIILFSLLVALNQVSIGGLVPLGSCALAILAIGYAIASPALGASFLLASAALHVAAQWLGGQGAAPAWVVAAVCFIGGWVLQFVGHIFERRRPAFTANIVQLFVAPAFIVLEAAVAAGLNKNLSDALTVRARKRAQAD